MYINGVYFQNQFPKAIKKMNVLARTQRYFSDLYQHYAMPLDFDLEAKRYEYEILAMHLFKKISRNISIKNCDYVFFTSPTFSVSSHYTAPELYFQHKLKWPGVVFDIRDIGALCVFHAIHLILKMSKQNRLKNSAIFSVENLDGNYVGCVQIDSDRISRTFCKILLCDIAEIKNLESHFTFILSQYHLKTDQYEVYVSAGVESIYILLDRLYKKIMQCEFPYIFIIDMDRHSNKFGMLLLERIK